MEDEREEGGRGDPDPPTLPTVQFDQEQNRQRFLMELEFVQTLANPEYLHFLALQRFFQDKAFVNYLKYLLYWKQPQYAKYLVYPHCLFFLDQLQSEHFRNELLHRPCIEFIHSQQFYHWQHYKKNRQEEAAKQAEGSDALGAAASSAATASALLPNVQTKTEATEDAGRG
ncbi:Mediator of RNA polymerase II transcription subunit 31 [Balamuthia mandrillaris]